MNEEIIKFLTFTMRGLLENVTSISDTFYARFYLFEYAHAEYVLKGLKAGQPTEFVFNNDIKWYPGNNTTK